MKYFIIVLLLFFRITLVFSQNEIPILEPKLSFELDFSSQSISHFQSKKAFNDCQKLFEKIKKEGREGTNDYTLSEQKVLFYCDETKDNIWQVEGGGCSWYCGGGEKKIEASSYLVSQGANSYKPENASDLNYKTAWVEGVNGYGLGEYLVYTFDGASPRITKIKILNGYIKSKVAWENNSRVKTLKMYVDNQPIAILNLKDYYGEQVFSVQPIGNGNRSNLKQLQSKPDWTLKFEILDVYKGLKYDDVAITEIYFSGLDVHCFAKGTKIKMADKSLKNIEDLKLGDLVSYMDLSTEKVRSAKIEKLESITHKGLVTYHFESGLKITTTKDHPFIIQGKGWASLKPEISEQYKGFVNVSKINIGDFFKTENKAEKLISIEFINNKQKTYTISKLSSGNNFIANGFIVGVEELK